MLVQLSDVTFAYTGTPVLTGAELSLHEGERVGFIGGNGEGKTTLIKLILGLLHPDGGTVTVKNGIRIGYLEQSGGFESEQTVYAAMEEIFAEDRELIARLRDVEQEMSRSNEEMLPALSARYESLNRRIAARDSYHFDVRIRTVLGGMGFSGVYDQVVSTMSGGEKTRLKLCRLLLEEPELLILDEPTNHLDLKTLFWLEEYLTSFRGALFVVSHDRYFLDRLTERTVELEQGKIHSYKGNYSRYKLLKAERVLTRQREYERQQEEIAKLQDYVDRNLVRATTAKSAQSRVKKLERMEHLAPPPPPPPPPHFRFASDERPYERVLCAERFTLRVQDKTLIRDASFTLLRGKKCALMGDNGTGKSTLLKFFLSDAPEVSFGKFVKIAYYDQENADLTPEERVLDAFWSKYSLMSQTQARNILAQAGLFAEDMDKQVKELSGGLRAKLELAILMARRGNLLILDEPTNHLDLPSREALEEALVAFDGTLLFVSHDRRFIEAIADEIAVIENGTLTLFEGGLTQYLEAEKKTPPPEKKPPEKKTESGYRSREERAREAQTRSRIKAIEERLEALEREETQLNEQLAACAADYEAVMRLTARLASLGEESESLYAEYEMLIS